jgi:hypothetical protein
VFVGAFRQGIKQLLAARAARLAAPGVIGTVENDTPRHFRRCAAKLSTPRRDGCLNGVLPSLGEPLGSVVYEGMSRGKAVVSATMT